MFCSRGTRWEGMQWNVCWLACYLVWLGYLFPMPRAHLVDKSPISEMDSCHRWVGSFSQAPQWTSPTHCHARTNLELMLLHKVSLIWFGPLNKHKVTGWEDRYIRYHAELMKDLDDLILDVLPLEFSGISLFGDWNMSKKQVKPGRITKMQKKRYQERLKLRTIQFKRIF